MFHYWLVLERKFLVVAAIEEARVPAGAADPPLAVQGVCGERAQHGAGGPTRPIQPSRLPPSGENYWNTHMRPTMNICC